VRILTETFEERESALSSGWGTAEIQSVFTEIDDARTIHDLKKIKVLEMGAGCGRAMERMINEWLIPNVRGIDMSEKSVKYCRGKGLKIELKDATKTGYTDKSFDYVYGIHLIDAVKMETAVKIVDEALRIAKKAMFVVAGDFNYMKLFKGVPNESHRITKNIVSYTKDATPYTNHLLIFYKQKVFKKER
jgi:ubiquinone/menaquinone biosynthesis C-methylase UbiE